MRLPEAITKDLRWKLISLLIAAVIWGAVDNITHNKTSVVENPLSPWESRTMTNQPVLIVSTAADLREFKVQPEHVTITVSGRPEIMNALQEKEIQAHVDLTDIESAPRGVRKRVVVSAPPGVIFVRAEPPDVEVVIPPRKK